MSKKLISATLTATTSVWLSGAMLLMPVAHAQSVDALQAQIASLLAQITALQAQIGASSGGSMSYTFTRDLTVGSKGDDVKALQQFLNSHGAQVAASGAGAPGSESTYFGALTKAAVAKWQTAQNISPAAGYFGPKTRAAV
ncbi:MAG: trimeric autotransporter adhesin, partial [Candidatus Parcubacteria bacterium]